MANCPNCGSDHIQLKRETNVNWGRAIAGYALFGIVGGAVGGMTGEDRTANACLDCGTSWKAHELYKILQIIEDYTGVKINLTIEDDRLYMNNFISTVIPHLQNISETKKRAEEIVIKTENEAKSNANPGYSGIGCAAIIGGLSTLGSISSGFGIFIILFISLSFFILCCIIDSQSSTKNQKAIDIAVENAQKKGIRMKLEAEENFRVKIKKFLHDNPR